MTDLSAFNAKVTQSLFKGSLPSWQAEPLRLIIAEGVRRKRPIQDIAYGLATAHHETSRFRYMSEIGAGRGKDYGDPVTLIRNSTAIYYGRGYVQLTWLQNYIRMSLRLSLEFGREINLVEHPELAMQPDYAALILWEGMIDGMFTGKSLSDYINRDDVDYVGARRIINGTDKADLIAGYAATFESALRASPSAIEDCPDYRAEALVA